MFTTRNFVALALVGLAASSVPAVANAQGVKANLARFAFERADANGDGKIDQAELTAVREARFARLDADADGTISADELDRQVARMQRRAMMAEGMADGAFDRLDANGDGVVTRAEFVEGRTAPILELADRDGDGAISRDEFERVAAVIGSLR